LRTAFVYKRDAAPLDAITQGSAELARHVAAASGHDCPVLPIGPGGLDAGAADGRDLLILEYNPFSFGRWGFAPWLPAQWARLRARRDRPKLAMRLHEMYVPMEDPKSTVMGAYQRAQLVPLAAACDLVYAVTTRWSREFVGSSRRFVHLPVSSNLPDRRDQRDAMRAELGLDPGTLAVVAFGSAHPSRMPEVVAAAVDRIAQERPDAVLLNLGQGGPENRLAESAGLRTITPGGQPDDTMAAQLSAGDLFLAPFSDGVSTRRGSFMAALQNELAAVTTSGPATDDVLRAADGDALLLCPAGDHAAFVDAAAALARDDARRRAVGAKGRALFDREFAWPVIARRLLALADEAA
jgi:glycosyltransferase involved in cell wall biosynthesis